MEQLVPSTPPPVAPLAIALQQFPAAAAIYTRKRERALEVAQLPGLNALGHCRQRGHRRC